MHLGKATHQMSIAQMDLPLDVRGAPTDLQDCSSLQVAQSQVASDRRSFAAQMTEERMQSSMTIRDEQFTLGDLIQHVTNHSTYHRGQVVLLLRLLGRVPPPTDFALFLLEPCGSAA